MNLRENISKLQNPKISIVIISWNTKYFLRKCIESVINAFHRISYEIIVVDNNSTDGSAEMVESFFPNIKLLRNDVNLGFAKANNQAMNQAKGEYFLLLNSDIEILDGAIGVLAEEMDKDYKIGAMGGMQLSPKNVIQTVSTRNFPILLTEFFIQMNLASRFPRHKIFARAWGTNFDQNKFQEVDVLSGAFMILRKSAIDDVGQFDENIFMYSEDIELCYRIKKAGYRLIYNPKAKAIHYFNQSVKKFEEITNRPLDIEALWSKYYFFKKHYGKPYALIFRIMTISTSVLWVIFWGSQYLFKKRRFLNNVLVSKINVIKRFLYGTVLRN